MTSENTNSRSRKVSRPSTAAIAAAASTAPAKVPQAPNPARVASRPVA